MKHRSTLILIAAALVAGCSEDQRLVDLANENAARQAEQNHEMARLNEHIAEGTKRLVEADAQARTELLKAEESLDQQRHEIDAERRQLVHERYRDPIIATTISSTAMLLACILPIAVAVYVLRNLGPRSTGDELAELLMQEMTSEGSVLLPHANQRPMIENDQPNLLPEK